MAEAKIVNGKALVAYVNGVGVDSEGAPIEGAPKPSKDTEPKDQPTASADPIHRLADTLNTALGNKAGNKAGDQSEDGETIKLPTLEKLPAKLKRVKTRAEVETMQKADDRVGAQHLYEARLAEFAE